MELTIALIAAVSALVGTALGGVISYFTAKAAKSMDWGLALKKDEIRERKELYGNFLMELNDLILSAFKTKHDDVMAFSKLGNLITSMELVSSDDVLMKAKAAADYALSSHTNNEKKVDRQFGDLRIAFVKAAKDELEALKIFK